MDHSIRRIITGHDDTGKAIVEVDGIAPNKKTRPGAGFVSTLLWVTDETPARVDMRSDRADRTMGVPPPPQGSVLRIVDFPPETPASNADSAALMASLGAEQPAHGQSAQRHAHMHRTKSVDYAIVLQGEITMLLDDSEVHMKAGDVLIQQATNHAWVNNGTDTCRIAFVLIDAVDPLA